MPFRSGDRAHLGAHPRRGQSAGGDGLLVMDRLFVGGITFFTLGALRLLAVGMANRATHSSHAVIIFKLHMLLHVQTSSQANARSR